MVPACLRPLLGCAALLLAASTFAAPGVLDPTFGSAGRALFDLSPTLLQGEFGTDLAIQPDGRILAVSESTNNFPIVVKVTRHLPDGALDASFGGGGVVALDVAGSGSRIALAADGKVLVATNELATTPTDAGPQVAARRQIVVTRLTASGQLDASFGSNGVAHVNPEGYTVFSDIALDASGRLLLAGETGPGTLVPPPPNGFPLPPQPAPGHWMVARLTASGTLDAGFGSSGIVASEPAPSTAQHVALLSDGRIVIAGRDAQRATLVSRHGADGALEARVVFAMKEWTGLAIDANDRLLLAADSPDGLWILRYGADFRPSGDATGPMHDLHDATLLALPDGSVYAATGGRLMRFSAAGGIDPGFADDGNLFLATPLARLARQADGRIVAVGTERGDPQANPMSLALLRIDPQATRFVASEALTFPVQSLGTISDEVILYVTNATGAQRTITVTASDGFEVPNNCATVAPGASCRVFVGHRPLRTAAPFGFATPVQGSVDIADDQGRHARIALDAAVENSLVRHNYRAILGRPADVDGAAFWNAEARRIRDAVQALSGGVAGNATETWYAMAMAFFASPEYRGAGFDDTFFVVDLYRAFLDRFADEAGLAYWVGQLAQGLPRDAVLAAFMFSPEYLRFNEAFFGSLPNRAEIDLVMDGYRGLLARLPDASGFAFWVGRLQQAQCRGAIAVRTEAESMTQLFAASAEYAGRARSDAEYVADLYNAILRRGPDLAGFSFWAQSLASGATTREAMRRAFVASPEFSQRVERVVAAGCRG